MTGSHKFPVVVGLILLSSCSGCSSDRSDSHHMASATSRPAHDIVFIEPGEQHGKYWVMTAHLETRNIHGASLLPIAQKLRFRESFDATHDTCKQIERQNASLNRGIAIVDSSHSCSIVLLYQLAGGDRGHEEWMSASTDEGTLRAWLLRHEPNSDTEAPTNDWLRLIREAPGDGDWDWRGPFTLRGSMSLRHSADDLLVETRDLRLQSRAVLPVFSKRFEFRIEASKRRIRDRGGDPTPLEPSFDNKRMLDPTSVEYEREQIWINKYYLENQVTDPALLEGTVYGEWRPKPRNIVWP